MQGIRPARSAGTIAQQFYAKYDGSPLPPKNIAQNVLATFGVPVDRTAAAFDPLIENATFVGFVKRIKDKDHIDIGSPIPVGDPAPGVQDPKNEEDPGGDTEAAPDESHVGHSENNPRTDLRQVHKNAIFLGHGSNRKPMDQLVKILNEYGIPHKQAVEEANRARPIPRKVGDVMRECGAAILVFTADKEFFDKDSISIWRPSENVSHELGAASVLSTGTGSSCSRRRGSNSRRISAVSATSSSRRTSLKARASNSSVSW